MLLPVQVTEQKNAIESKVIWISGKIQKCWWTFFYLKLLKPIEQLSLNFEKEKLDIVSAAIALEKVKEKLLKLENKDVNDFNQIKAMKKCIKELKDGKVEYRTICLKGSKLN